MDDRTITLLLRLIHILGGIFWVGAAFVAAGFLVPAVRATGREGGQFMQYVMQKRRLPVFLGVAMVLTVLSGFALFARLAAASGGAWASSRSGIGYGIGGAAAVLGALVGAVVNGSAGRRMAAIGERARDTGSPPPEQQGEIERLQARIAVGSRMTAGLLAIAAAAMAISRYL
jgi:uncharacterized membrane protein